MSNARLRNLEEALHRGTAAEADETRLLEVGEVHEHTRADAEGAEPPARLRDDDAANGEPFRSDRQRVADLDVQLRQQLRTHEHAEVLEQRVTVGPIVGELHPAVVRERPLDRAKLHHPGASIGAIGRTRHGRQLDRSGALGARRVETLIDLRDQFRLQGLIAGDDRVGRDERTRLAGKRVADALDDRSQRDDGADADRDADEEKQQPVP